LRQLYDAIIIGAGIIGACTGYEMAKRGYKVLNIDKLELEPEDIKRYLPNVNLASYFPQKWVDDPEFG